MAFLAPLAPFVGLALGAVGIGVQYKAAKDQAKAIKKENKARELAAMIEARRNRRKAIREAWLARSMSAAQGAGQGMFGSSMAGAEAGITNTAQRTLTNTNQNVEIGGRINQAQTQQADAATLSSLGSGVSSIGGSIYNASDSLGRLKDYYTGTNKNGYP